MFSYVLVLLELSICSPRVDIIVALLSELPKLKRAIPTGKRQEVKKNNFSLPDWTVGITHKDGSSFLQRRKTFHSKYPMVSSFS